MLSFKYRLYSNHTKQLNNMINICGSIHNHIIVLYRRYYRMYKKSCNPNKMSRHLTKLRYTTKFEYWNLINSQNFQIIHDRICKGYKKFFEDRKHGKKTGIPKFQKVRKYSSIGFKNCGWKIENNVFSIINRNKIVSSFKFIKHRDYYGNIRTIAIKRDNLKHFYIIIVTDAEIENIPSIRSGQSVGIDFGIKQFLTLSNGIEVDSPLFLTKEIDKLKELSNKYSKTSKANKYNARKNLARFHSRVANKRRDWHIKTAIQLSNDYGWIAVETLDIESMKQEGNWGRKLSDEAPSNFYNWLEYQCLKRNKTFIKTGKYFASSKLCSVCGYKNTNLTLADREWECPKCSMVHPRDLNASINILKESKRLGRQPRLLIADDISNNRSVTASA